MFYDDIGPNDDSCPNCGAQSCHQKPDADVEPPEWFGIGENESCSLCGAEHEHFLGDKIALPERSVGYLLQLLEKVEYVYTGQKYMAQNDILKNREYFQSICDALALINKNHIPNRFEDWHRKQLIKRHINLYAQVHGGTATKGLVKYSDYFYALADEERNALVGDLEDNLTQKQYEMEADRKASLE
jgi:hypothetical protein